VKMEKGKVVRVVDFVIFIILVSFFSLFSGAMVFKSDPEPLKEIFFFSSILLFNVFMIFLYIKSYKLSLNDNWFKASFIFKIISLLSPLIIFLILFIFSTISGPAGWEGFGIFIYGFYLSWVVYMISMILFLIGYVKNKRKNG